MDPASAVVLVESIVAAASGPAAATVLLAALVGGSGWVLVKHVLPLIAARLEKQDKNLERVIEAHEKNVKAILKEHKEDREAFERAVKAISERVDRVDTVLVKVDSRLSSLERVLTDSSNEGERQ